ncbi:DNA primase [Candidatus Woesearchaeota archaeon]|nr:DNA primase [Candidatus Woesearchaeota archaeon]
MAKISPVSAKYIVHTQIQIEGVVDKPDVIGAIFGQTEGLLGSDLELRELQRSGRIGRIEVNSETRYGKTFGTIIIPSSLDKAETAIIAASLETIQRIGPCNSKVKIERIEDVRISKRNFVIERAKELLKVLTDSVLPDSQEITDEVAQSVRMMEIVEYGKDRLPAGPSIDESDEVIVVEGRADVLNLLKHGIKNAIGLNGTSVPETIIELGRRKILTVFVDGDRGGELIIKEISSVTEIDFVTRAPDGKEVEEITKKEIHKALRSKITVEQIGITRGIETPEKQNNAIEDKKEKIEPRITNVILSPQQKQNFKKMLDDLIGTRGAYILDQEMNILGKVPTSELVTTIKSLNSVFAVVFDGIINKDIINIADRANVKYLVGMESRVRPNDTRAEILINNNF